MYNFILKNTITKYLKISLDETFLILNTAFKKIHAHTHTSLIFFNQYLFELQVVMAPTGVCINS